MKKIALTNLFICICSFFCGAQQYEPTFNRSSSIDVDYANTSWKVPSGVTEIAFDLWGAGGNGGTKGSGQAGGYVHGYMTVIPGSFINLIVGKSDGSTSTTFGSFEAKGGASDGSNNGGGFKLDNNLTGWGLVGQFGKPAKSITYQYLDPSNYILTFKGGEGGNGERFEHTSGDGLLIILRYNTKEAIYKPILLNQILPGPGNVPGGGGGSGYFYFNNSNQVKVDGGKGGNGKIIIYY